MGKTRDLFKKIGAIKGIFHVETGTIKNKNIKELTEAEEIKKRWQEYTEDYTKMIFMTQIPQWCDHSPRARFSGMQSQVGFRKHHYEQTSGGDGIELSYFKS